MTNIWDFMLKATPQVALITMAGLITIFKEASDGLIFLIIGFIIIIILIMIEIAWREYMKITGGPERYGYQ
ncbi:MAG: hypothetical protein ACOC1P_02680 [Minisyncoccales bacterium]